MELRKYQSDELVKYWDTQEPINIPTYTFCENEVRGIWVSNVANIDTPKGLPVEEYQAYLKQMIKNIRDKMKNKKGFTLVELIVVLVILAILAAKAFVGARQGMCPIVGWGKDSEDRFSNSVHKR